LHGLKERGLAGQSRIDFGKPGDVILRIAEDLSVDLIIMGTKPHSPLRRRFLGATVDKVIDHAHCSVLVVRSDAQHSQLMSPDKVSAAVTSFDALCPSE